MCASPLSPRHAQPDWMGGGLASRQMMHAPPSATIFPLPLDSAPPLLGADEWGVLFGSVKPPQSNPSKWPREKWPRSQVPSHRWYGQQLCWSQHGPRVALERSLHRPSMATMLIVAAGSRFPPGSETTRQEAFVPDAIAMGYGCHCGRCGRIGANSESAGALFRVTGMIKRVAAGPQWPINRPSRGGGSAARTG